MVHFDTFWYILYINLRGDTICSKCFRFFVVLSCTNTIKHNSIWYFFSGFYLLSLNIFERHLSYLFLNKNLCFSVVSVFLRSIAGWKLSDFFCLDFSIVVPIWLGLSLPHSSSISRFLMVMPKLILYSPYKRKLPDPGQDPCSAVDWWPAKDLFQTYSMSDCENCIN